ncbi:MAG: restriction endonuclease subunit S [Bacteroidales bacterium]
MNYSLLPKFIYYYFCVIDECYKQNVNISSFPSVEMERLKKQPFPIPPLSEQK